MRQLQHDIDIATHGQGLYDFTAEVALWLQGSGIRDGLLTLFLCHTSASLIVQENADPEVQGDLVRFLERLAPENDPIYRHTLEGPDDMPAHVRAALTQTHLAVPVRDGKMVLGIWQALYLIEHRHAAHQRQIAVHLLGE